LRRWEELRPELDALGVKIVTICRDTPAQIRKGRSKHELRAVMLADPELAVTTSYNLRNERNLSPHGLGPLPIPTTFLVDASGVVRWIDQSTDYQVRSNPDRVKEALSLAAG
jgi:peroxiredoxin